ncbi:MAG TPA: PaaI family thioesterase [Terriglobales bacterium]|nr:PaaI family thioesterase [Terriglobales bacterium]
MEDQKTESGRAPRKHAPLNPRCMVCGAENPHGLRIRFSSDKEGASAEWSPQRDCESFTGVIHGGIVATVMDEAMSKAIIARDWEAMTVDLHTRFHHRLKAGHRVHICGWVVERRKRKILAEASIRNSNGREEAHAWGTFLLFQADKVELPQSNCPTTSTSTPSALSKP